MYGIDTSSPDAVVAWYERFAPSGLPGDMPAWVGLQEECNTNPAAVPTILEAARRLLRDGDDLVRSEVLALFVGRDPAFERALVTQPPPWADHPDPQAPGNRLGRRIVAGALADLARRDAAVAALCEPLVARFGAWEEWAFFWLATDPGGRAVDVLADHVAAGRSLQMLAAPVGATYATSARGSLLRVTDIVAKGNLQDRAWFASKVDQYLPAHEAALKREVHARLGI
jgi:hypothetical protein